MGGTGGLVGTRFLSQGYDRGFLMGMRTFFEAPVNTAPASQAATPPAKKVPYSIATSFVAVTALAPHQDMETEYKKEFADVRGYIEGRDTPNYVGIEVQRAEINDKNANQELAESDWKTLPNVGTEEFKKFAKNMIGTCADVHRPVIAIGGRRDQFTLAHIGRRQLILHKQLTWHMQHRKRTQAQRRQVDLAPRLRHPQKRQVSRVVRSLLPI